MQKLPGLFGVQPGIGQQDLEACAQRGAGFPGLAWGALFRTLVDTMCIMLSNMIVRIILTLDASQATSLKKR